MAELLRQNEFLIEREKALTGGLVKDAREAGNNNPKEGKNSIENIVYLSEREEKQIIWELSYGFASADRV